MGKAISVRLADDLLTQLDQLAANLDRPRSWVIEQAIARYVEEEGPQVAAIAAALAEYRSGNAVLIPHEVVMRELDQRIRARTGE